MRGDDKLLMETGASSSTATSDSHVSDNDVTSSSASNHNGFCHDLENGSSTATITRQQPILSDAKTNCAKKTTFNAITTTTTTSAKTLINENDNTGSAQRDVTASSAVFHNGQPSEFNSHSLSSPPLSPERGFYEKSAGQKVGGDVSPLSTDSGVVNGYYDSSQPGSPPVLVNGHDCYLSAPVSSTGDDVTSRDSDTCSSRTDSKLLCGTADSGHQTDDEQSSGDSIAKSSGLTNGDLIVTSSKATAESINDDGDPESKSTKAILIDSSMVEDMLLLQDNSFTIKIVPPGNNAESFDLQVSSMELVQEIHQVLMDREDTCHRTCFSLQLAGKVLDNFTELKAIEGMEQGAVVKVIEEPYTAREARIHLRHVRDLIKSLDLADAINGNDCASLSFLNGICKRRKMKLESSIDCTPPDYIMPGLQERPFFPLMPFGKELIAVQCMKVLGISSWNPPPGTRKLKGDLLYIYVLTMEDKRYHITASTKGFFVNQSTEDVFNPSPAASKLVFHSLVDLFSQISAAFKKHFSVVQRKRCQKHPFERVSAPYQSFLWTAPALEHSADAIRAEDAFSFKLGYEEHIPGQTREWNEELQTTRELPRNTMAERLLRERAIFKVHSDFVSAATRGAVAVIDGNVMAINPGEDSKMQMFIWNNIFFSLGFDVKDHYKDYGGDAAAHVAPSNDLAGVRAYFSLDPEGLYVLGTVLVDYRGYRVTAQSIIPGILERDQEQSVVYGSVDFGKTIVSAEKYQQLLEKPAAQLKILPHLLKNKDGESIKLYTSFESKGIVGNDGRHYILDLLRTFPPDVNFLPDAEVTEICRQNGFPRSHRHKLSTLRQELIDAFVESRYALFIKVAASHLQRLRLKPTSTSSEKPVEVPASIENGHDSKKSESNNVLSDKVVEVSSLEIAEKIKQKISNREGSPSSDPTLPPAEKAKEIMQEFKSTEDETFESATKEIIRKASEVVCSMRDDEFDIRFNPDCYCEGIEHENPEDLPKQKRLIQEAAQFLLATQIPNFIRECVEHSYTPLDGVHLTEALHTRGINVRYLGKVLEYIETVEVLDYLRAICLSELVSRGATHLFRTYIQAVDQGQICAAVAHFLNCLLGSCATLESASNHDDSSNAAKISNRRTSKKNRKSATSVISFAESSEWCSMTPKSLWKDLVEEVVSYFGYRLECDGIDELIEKYDVTRISLLRRVCMRCGIQLLLKEYQLECHTRPCFGEDDINNMFPVVKHINPKATDASSFYTTGQAKIQQGHLRAGYELVSEALNLLNNVYGAMHPEIAQCLRLLARLSYILGDHQEALSQQQKAVLMSERCSGIDHPNTILEYTHMALYCFANWQVSTALKLLYRARYLLLVAHGENHPHMSLLDSNIGLILHAVSEYDLSVRFLEHALELNTKYFGEKSLKVALSNHLIARTQSCRGDFRTALQFEKETFNIYRQVLGEEHEKTRESSECLRHLTQQAVSLQKRMNEITKNAGSLSQILPLQIQQPSFSSVLDVLNIVNGIVFVQLSPKEVEALRADISKTGGIENIVLVEKNKEKDVSDEQDDNTLKDDGPTVTELLDTTDLSPD